MENIHAKDCNCKICNNGIREERQYAALKIEEHFIIFDAEEYQHFDDWIRNKTENEKQLHPTYCVIEPEDGNKLQLVYGVLIPACETEISDWNKELEKFKGYAFATLEDEKIYLSAYQDIALFENMKTYETNIPCAMLLDTALDLEDKKDYGFGHTMFLKYGNMEIFNNIFNRKFLFCVRDVEAAYDSVQGDWKDFINEEVLKRVAKELF